ncbi:hypothetical protein VNO80_11613 [Phaseolus coccineus]|uniref:Uncharacterized protein n=1 Tax=Phaseolus coccineus TaxID=3886 RepID=A0AAN9RF41_PHACN
MKACEGVIKTSIVKATGIMEDIRFDDPYSNKKVDKDLNGSQSQNHSLLQSIGNKTSATARMRDSRKSESGTVR